MNTPKDIVHGTDTGRPADRNGAALATVETNQRRAILRALIANDEACVRHFAAQLEDESGIIDALPTPTGYPPEREALLEKLGDALRRLQLRRAELVCLRAAQDKSRPGSSPEQDPIFPATENPRTSPTSNAPQGATCKGAGEAAGESVAGINL